VDELTMTYEIRRSTTVMTVSGVVDGERAAKLDEGLEMARTMRGRGPIVVDLDGVDEIAPAALLSLLQAAEDFERTGRPLTIEGLFPVRILPGRSAG